MNFSDPFKTISDLFEDQVKLHPENIAVYLEDRRISYNDFNKQANQYARYLQKKGLLSNEIVGIQLTRSYEMLVAIFAVFKAGGAYLPLDPNVLVIRNQAVLQDSQIKFLIIDDSLSFTSTSELYTPRE